MSARRSRPRRQLSSASAMRVQLDERARDNERARRRILVSQGVQALLRLFQLGEGQGEGWGHGGLGLGLGIGIELGLLGVWFGLGLRVGFGFGLAFGIRASWRGWGWLQGWV